MALPNGLYVNAAASGTVTIDLALFSSALLTITGNTVLAFSNTPALNNETRCVVTFINGRAFSVTYPAGTRHGGAGVVGSAPTLQAAGTDKVAFDIYNNGAVVYDAAYVGRFA